MWNKRSEPEARPTPDNYQRPQAPAYTPPAPAAEPDAQRSRAASIGPSVTIKGEIRAKEELHIDGDVEGSVESQHRVTIGPSGKVRANINAREVVIMGSVNGHVHAAEKITIRKSATLVGDIKTAGIVIDDGAYFKGSIDILRAEPKKEPVPAPAPVGATSPARPAEAVAATAR